MCMSAAYNPQTGTASTTETPWTGAGEGDDRCGVQTGTGAPHSCGRSSPLPGLHSCRRKATAYRSRARLSGSIRLVTSTSGTPSRITSVRPPSERLERATPTGPRRSSVGPNGATAAGNNRGPTGSAQRLLSRNPVAHHTKLRSRNAGSGRGMRRYYRSRSLTRRSPAARQS